MNLRSVDPRALVAAFLSLAAVAGALWRGPFIHRPAMMPEIMVDGTTRAEGCLRCHDQVQGLGPSHDAKTLGCSVCHLGDPTALDARAAHRGMLVVCGELKTIDRTCGQSGCHPSQAGRVSTAIMAGAPGLLAVDRFAFGESATPDGSEADDLRAIDATRPPTSLAQSHVRKLCGSCHLGAPKSERGDQGFFSRGGGCTACHLGRPHRQAKLSGAGPLHPDISSAVSEDRCQGCHSRSGRISLSFHGLVERDPADPQASSRLPDGRAVGVAAPDIHRSKDMTCVDCHVDRELMGDGVVHMHSHQATHVRCEDCHGPWDEHAAPSADLVRAVGVLRRAWEQSGRAALPEGPSLTTRDGIPLWRTHAASRSLVRASDGERVEIPAASQRRYHVLAGHARLSCQACHTQWAPRCPSCHTRFDPRATQFDHLAGAETPGAWTEMPFTSRAAEPALAVGPRGLIQPFVEGMRLTIEAGGPLIERNMWAPLDAHTTGKSRSCGSCHAPVDASLVYPEAGQTTRTGAKLLDEQQREKLARVGRCITCHSSYDDEIYVDFGASLERLRRFRAGERIEVGARLARCGG